MQDVNFQPIHNSNSQDGWGLGAVFNPVGELEFLTEAFAFLHLV
jgi:hypothetical protein